MLDLSSYTRVLRFSSLSSILLPPNVRVHLTVDKCSSLDSEVPFFIHSFFSQDEGADLPFAPPMKGNLFLVPNGVRPVMQRTAIEVCLLESVCRCQKLLTSYCKLLVFCISTLNRRHLVRTLVITNIQRDFKEHRSRRGSLL